MNRKKLPKIISQDEFEQLFEYVRKLESKLPSTSKRKIRLKQYRLAMLLGFESGLRISEIIGYVRTNGPAIPPLDKSNIKMQANQIEILDGKGGKDRVTLKPTRLGPNARNMFPLTIRRRALQKFITEIGYEVLNKKITFHTLRHGFGSHLAGSGRPLHEIQMLLGHSRLDTTGIYLHANPKKATDAAIEVF